jgi:hypothetical protein
LSIWSWECQTNPIAVTPENAAKTWNIKVAINNRAILATVTSAILLYLVVLH